MKRWAVVIGEWVVLLPLWRRWIRSRWLRVGAAALTGLVWLTILSVAVGGGESDKDGDTVQAVGTPSETATAPASTPTQPLTPQPTATTTDAPTSTPEPETPTPTASLHVSIEYGLTIINAQGDYVSEDDPIVDEFRRLMEALDSYCPENAKRIADMLVAADKQLADRGGSRTLLEITRNLNYLLEPPVTELVGDSCADEIALLVIVLIP